MSDGGGGSSFRHSYQKKKKPKEGKRRGKKGAKSHVKKGNEQRWHHKGKDFLSKSGAATVGTKKVGEK